MYINHIDYKTNFHHNIKKIPVSDRVKQYFEDLYSRNGTELSIDMSVFVNDYMALGKLLFDEIYSTHELKNAQTIFFPVWAVSWNMEYATPELHWKEKYQIDATFLDVRDCGSLCVYYAFHLMLKLQKSETEKNNVCCSIENAFLPNLKNNHGISPSMNYIASVIFSHHSNDKNSLKIIMCDIYDMHQINSIDQLKKTINNVMQTYDISENEHMIYIRKNTDYFSIENCISIAYPISSGFAYYCLSLIYKSRKKINFKNIFIIDLDHANSLMGILFVKIQ